MLFRHLWPCLQVRAAGESGDLTAGSSATADADTVSLRVSEPRNGHPGSMRGPTLLCGSKAGQTGGPFLTVLVCNLLGFSHSTLSLLFSWCLACCSRRNLHTPWHALVLPFGDRCRLVIDADWSFQNCAWMCSALVYACLYWAAKRWGEQVQSL